MSARFLLSAQLEQGPIEIQTETIDNLYDEVISPVISVLTKDSISPLGNRRTGWRDVSPLKCTETRIFCASYFRTFLAMPSNIENLTEQFFLTSGTRGQVPIQRLELRPGSGT